MTLDYVPLLAVVIMLFALIYFLLASIPFLFVSLDTPAVSSLFRGLFNVYFPTVGVIGIGATAAFAASGRIALAAAMLLLAVTLIAARRAVVRRIDTQQSAGLSGDAAAVRRLRFIHLGGMLVNSLVLATVAGSIPFIT